MLKLSMTADQASLFCERFLETNPSATPVWDVDGLMITDPYAAAAQALFDTGLPLTKAELVAYANARQWAKAIGGKIETINGNPVPFSTTPDSLNFLSGKVQRLNQPDPPATINWQTGPSTFTVIAAADFIEAATNIADFFQSTFDTLGDVFGKIASNDITTTAQIDAAFSA